MNERERFLARLDSDPLESADAIVVLEGDGLVRVEKGAELFKQGLAPRIVLSGGLVHPPHSISAGEMLPHLLSLGVPREAVILEERSQHTREQADEVIALAKEQGWKSLILVASDAHQYRAFLTFVKAAQDAGLSLCLISGAVAGNTDRLPVELARTEEYQKKGDVASFEEGLEYLEWKDANPA